VLIEAVINQSIFISGKQPIREYRDATQIYIYKTKLDTKLVRQTCTQYCDHGILTVWPSRAKTETAICTHSVKAWESSFE